MAGFFNAAAYRAEKVRGCASCGLSRGCLSPKMLGTGAGERHVLFLAEAPGEDEDRRGVQLIGQAGQLLRGVLQGLGWDLDRDCRKLNAVNCRPPKNRKPEDHEIEACRRYLTAELAEHRPQVIIPMGGTALKSLYGNRYSRDLGGIMSWRGYTIPDGKLGAWVCPTLHPSYILRKGSDVVAMAAFRNDLRAALGLVGTAPPVYSVEALRQCVTVAQTPREAGTWLIGLLKHPPPITAFDYESTGLKPQRQGHKIVSVGIAASDTECVSFPLHLPGAGWDRVRSLFAEYLASPIRKATWNQQMEMRWSKAMFNVWPAAIVWDGQLAAHVLDCRRGVVNLKFQVAVNLGVLNYESTVEQYKKTQGNEKARYGENGFNGMDQAPFLDVALYGGLDSLFTLLLAKRQRKAIIEQTKED